MQFFLLLAALICSTLCCNDQNFLYAATNFGRFANQLIGIAKALVIGKKLNLTTIIPPFYDLDRFEPQLLVRSVLNFSRVHANGFCFIFEDEFLRSHLTFQVNNVFSFGEENCTIWRDTQFYRHWRQYSARTQRILKLHAILPRRSRFCITQRYWQQSGIFKTEQLSPSLRTRANGVSVTIVAPAMLVPSVTEQELSEVLYLSFQPTSSIYTEISSFLSHTGLDHERFLAVHWRGFKSFCVQYMNSLLRMGYIYYNATREALDTCDPSVVLNRLPAQGEYREIFLSLDPEIHVDEQRSLRRTLRFHCAPPRRAACNIIADIFISSRADYFVGNPASTFSYVISLIGRAAKQQVSNLNSLLVPLDPQFKRIREEEWSNHAPEMRCID